MDLGGTDTQRLLAFNIRLIRDQGMLQVVNEEGRVLYMNQDMRKCLGVKDISVSLFAYPQQILSFMRFST